MTLKNLIRYLRNSVSVQNPLGVDTDDEGNEVEIRVDTDPAYLSMTDEDLSQYIEIAAGANFPDISIKDDIPTENVYAITLLSKRELYFALAVKDAPLYDLGADSAYIKRSQRFDHYMTLIKQLDDEYQLYLDNGGAGANTVSSSDVLLSNRWGTKYNYEKGAIPALSLYVRNIKENSVDIEWKAKLSRFANYKVYISENEIVDMYVYPPISENLKPAAVLTDIHRTRCRIEGLNPDTTYFVAISVSEKNGLTGYATKEFTTPAEEVVELPPVIEETPIEPTNPDETTNPDSGGTEGDESESGEISGN